MCVEAKYVVQSDVIMKNNIYLYSEKNKPYNNQYYMAVDDTI